MNNSLPTPDRLWSLWDYSLITGEVFSRRTGRLLRGDRNHKGYIRDKVDGVKYFRHRLIWRMITGEDIGELTIDHDDKIRDNNSWINLSVMTRRDNIIKDRDSLGHIYRHGTGWRLDIHLDGSRHRRYYKSYDLALTGQEDLSRELGLR